MRRARQRDLECRARTGASRPAPRESVVRLTHPSHRVHLAVHLARRVHLARHVHLMRDVRLASFAYCTVAAAIALATLPGPARAQRSAPPPRPEVRADLIAARTSVLEAGAGVNVALGRLLRLEFVGAAGSTLEERPRAAGRVDAVLRFVLDPYAERRWGFYGGGGVSARFMRGEPGQGRLALVVGVEGRAARGIVPFAELGLGGGARIGLGLRRSVRGWR